MNIHVTRKVLIFHKFSVAAVTFHTTNIIKVVGMDFSEE